MIIKPLDYELSVCKVADVSQLDLSQGFFFIGRTDEELSLVCETSRVPSCTTARSCVPEAPAPNCIQANATRATTTTAAITAPTIALAFPPRAIT